MRAAGSPPARRGRFPPVARTAAICGSTMSHTVVKNARRSSRLRLLITEPPPSARTMGEVSDSRARASRAVVSRFLKTSSPSRAKISGMVIPRAATIRSSRSTKGRPRILAKCRPTLVFPEAGNPVRAMDLVVDLGPINLISDRLGRRLDGIVVVMENARLGDLDGAVATRIKPRGMVGRR